MELCDDSEVLSSCRLCLSASDVDSVFAESQLGVCFAEILNNILNNNIPTITSSDNLSKNICKSCQNSSVAAYTFVQMCVTSDQRVRKSLEPLSEIKADDASEGDLVEATLSIDDSNDMMLPELKPIEEEYDNESPNDDSQDESDGSSGIGDEDKLNDSKEFCCDSCDKTFSSKSQMLQHATDFHDEGKCKSTESDDNESLDDDESERIFTCDACPKNFKKPSLLARHVKTHDPNRRPHEW